MQISIKFLFLSLLVLFTFASCGDDDCEGDSLQETIVGEWTFPLAGSGTAEFKSDGTLVDPNGIIIEGEINGVVLEEKSWLINSDGDIEVKAEDGSSFVDGTYTVDGFTCDEIMVSVFGIPATLERK